MPKKGYRQTEEHTRKCAEWRRKHLKGRKIARSIVERQLEGRLRWYETHRVWNLGKPHTEITRNKISLAMKEYWKRRKKEGR